MRELIERDTYLTALRDHLLAIAGGTGHTVLLSGEAGIGKTSVVKHLVAESAGVPIWWGACDALQTPHPLAPLHDIARSAKVRFGALIESGSNRSALFEAVLDELRASSATLVVIEDAHWADDATLDFIKFLGRRIDRVPALMVVTFRDDEIGSWHPLRRVIGDLPASLMTRYELPRLSPAGVDTLAQRALQSAAGIHATTQGNPFFVTEMLMHGSQGVPRTVQDLVLARLARLSQGAQAIVRLASIVPARIERWLIDDLLTPSLTDLETCLNSGLLIADSSTLFFRHELARVAVEASLPPPIAQTLHANVLAASVKRGSEWSPARLVHHAAHAMDAAAVLKFAPIAAEQARVRGAHREAAAHYRTALGQDTAGDADRARWLEAYASECQLIDQLGEAIDARGQAIDWHRRQSDTLREAENLSQLALVFVLALKNADADAASRQAIALLETLPPCVQLASAYRVEAQLRMLNRDCRESAEWGSKAIALAQQFGDRHVLAAAYSTLGTATMFLDYDAGCAHLRRALDIALADGLHYVAANTYSNLGSGSGEIFRLREAEQYLRETIAFAGRHEIDFYRNYAVSWLALCDLYLGRWDDAAAHASDITTQSGQANTSRIMALIALGRLRVRRGDPGADEALDEALELALATGTLQRIAPVRAARAEAAFGKGDLPRVIAEAGAALDLALRHEHAWFIGELSFWMWRGGACAVAPVGCAAPYALQISGRWREAAQAWACLGCPFEQARALADGDAEAQCEALAVLDGLGARPAADALRQRLRAAGVRGVPRGARPSTQGNPHGLTARELEVLQLLSEGLKNSEIAERLFRSVRTIDHHLSAIFAKLGVDSRAAAVTEARRAGIAAGQNRQSDPPN